MKRRLYLLLLGFGLLLPTISLASAPSVGAIDLFHNICTPSGNDSGTDASNTDVCKEKASAPNKNPVITAIGVAITILSFIIGIVAVIMIVVSGFKIVMSQGDSQKVANARTAIIYSLIGLATAILAGSIVTLVLSKL